MVEHGHQEIWSFMVSSDMIRGQGTVDVGAWTLVCSLHRLAVVIAKSEAM